MNQSEDDLLINGKSLSSLRVVDLKEELEKRGLSKSGNKKELIEKLRIHLLSELAVASKETNVFVQPPVEAETSAPLTTEVNAIHFSQPDESVSINEIPSTEPPVIEKQPDETPLNLSQSNGQAEDPSVSIDFKPPTAEQVVEDVTQISTEPTINVPEPTLVSSEEQKEMEPEVASETTPELAAEPASVSLTGPITDLVPEQVEKVAESSELIEDKLSETEKAEETKVEHDTQTNEDTPVISESINQSINSEKEFVAEESMEVQIDNAPKVTISEVEDKSVGQTSGEIKTKIAFSKEIEEGELKEQPQQEVRRLSIHKPTLTRTSSDSFQRTDEKKRRWGGSSASALNNSSAISSDALKELIKTAPKVPEKVSAPEEGEIVSTKSQELDAGDSIEIKTANTDKSIASESDETQNRPKSPAKNEPTNVLLVTNLVRPFTLPRLKELLSRKGRIFTDKFWIDDIKSKCYAVYENKEVAIETREFIHGLKWPISGSTTLAADFVPLEELEQLLEREKEVRDKAAAALISPEVKQRNVEQEAAQTQSNEEQDEKNKSVSENKSESLERKPEPAKNAPSNIISVRNLVRPFTLDQLKELLTRFGSIDQEKFWIDRIKSKCFAVYENVEIAQQSRDFYHGLKWPKGNPKTLVSDFATEDELNFHLTQDVTIKRPSDQSFNRNVPSSEERKRKVPDQREDRQNESSESEAKLAKMDQTRDNVRDWDREKLNKNELSRNQFKRNRDFTPSPERKPYKNDRAEKSKKEEPTLLDNLFRKTKTLPYIYWLPLSEAEAEQQVRIEKPLEVENGRRNERAEVKRNDNFNNGRRPSPVRRNISPPNRGARGQRSPARRPSSPRRSSPYRRQFSPRRSSPLRRQASPRRQSPPRRQASPRRDQRSGRPSYRGRSPVRSRNVRDRSYSPIGRGKPRGRPMSRSRSRSRGRRSYDAYSRSPSPHRSPAPKDSRRYPAY